MRFSTTDAIVIGTRKFGEIHKSLTLFSPTLGSFDAIVFGGRKGKKTALAPLFAIGQYTIYENPVKKEFSIAEGQDFFVPSNITNDIYLTYAASFFCEVVNKCQTDNAQEIFDILSKSLILLENEPSLRKRVIIAFIWKFLLSSGTVPDLTMCPECERTYKNDEILGFSNASYTPACMDCSDNKDFILPPGARRYLIYTSNKTLEESAHVILNPKAEDRILHYLLKWLSIFSQNSFKTLSSGFLL
ncbi:MAG: DNA repair protein RecO [Sphaerochaetaceae bacterium]|nr:DNA repair protein RecO [Sphaerochaetaceae bacterium]